MKTIAFLLFSFCLFQSYPLSVADTIYYISSPNGPTCAGDNCLAFPDDIHSLKNIFQSDTTVVFERGIYHISLTYTGGLVQVEHVTNLSLVGYGEETQIVCSPNATFGFAFNNVSGVTITGLTVSQCSADVPQSVSVLVPLGLDRLYEYATYTDIFTESDMNVTAFLEVVDSVNVTVSDTSIRESPGYAVIATSSSRSEAFPSSHKNMPPNAKVTVKSFSIIVEDCDLSLNQQGSLLLYRAAAKFSSTTFTDNTIGVLSFDSILSLIDVVVLRSAIMSVEGGRMQVGGATSIQQSQTNVMKSHFEVFDGDVTFSNILGSNSTGGLTVVGSLFRIIANSSIHFAGNHVSFNTSALEAQMSNITIGDNATLHFDNNTVIDLATLVDLVDCTITIRNNATILFEHNSVTDAGTVLSMTASSWDVKEESRVMFQNNTAQNGGRIVELIDSELNLHHNTVVILSKNIVLSNCQVFAIQNTNLNLYNHSTLIFTQNTAEQSSTVCATVGKFNSNDNTKVVFTNNLAIHKSHIVISHTKLQRTTRGGQASVTTIGNGNTVPTGGNAITTGGNGVILLDPPVFPLPSNGGPFVFSSVIAMWNINEMGTILFDNNRVLYGGSVFTCIGCRLFAKQFSALSFTSNLCINSSYIMYAENIYSFIGDNASFSITNNSLAHSSALLLSHKGTLQVSSDATFSVLGNRAENAFSILLFSATVRLSGSVLISQNIVTDFGTLYVVKSYVFFMGSLECSRNRAESGAITATDSNIYVIGDALFLENTAENGGAVSLITSVMYVSPSATVTFTRNYAKERGGAVYLSNPPNTFVCNAQRFVVVTCSFQTFGQSSDQCELFKMNFHQNVAGLAGNAVYGDRTSACIPSSYYSYCSKCSSPNFMEIMQYSGVGNDSDLSNFTSDPTRVCFCEDGIPNCYNVKQQLTVHPGELFNISLAIIGYGYGTVPGSVVAKIQLGERDSSTCSLGSRLQYSQDIGTHCTELSYSVLSDKTSEDLILAVDTLSFGPTLSEVRAVVEFQLDQDNKNINSLLRSPYDSLYETFFHIPVFVSVNLLPCPVGFQMIDGQCTCAQVLLDSHISSCTIVNGTPYIHRPIPYWIGLPTDNASSLLVHSQCPYDYCKPYDLNITPHNHDIQCQFQRSGTLCGKCRGDLSMVLGSSECKMCSNAYLSLITVFAVAGIALVIFLSLFNLTVSVGTISGLVFYANVVQACQPAFLPPSYSANGFVALLKVFIAWVNLDLGIPTCFYSGMDAYAKTWLQFTFPVYILSIATTIIITSHYSSRVAKLFGSHPVQVLATLFLLSYTKILRTLITAFSFTVLVYPDNSKTVVWLVDGSVEYFGLKHTILFTVALLVLVFVALPYTSLLLLVSWMQRSKYWVSSLYNKFKPLFDAYAGPYKDNCRYWTGLLLLVRVVLIILFSSNINTDALGGLSLNLLLITLATSCLLAATAAVQPYKETKNNILECFYLLNLVFLSSSSLYVSFNAADHKVYIFSVLVGMSFLSFLLVSSHHGYIRMSALKFRCLDIKSHTDIVQMKSLERKKDQQMYRESVLDLSI